MPENKYKKDFIVLRIVVTVSDVSWRAPGKEFRTTALEMQNSWHRVQFLFIGLRPRLCISGTQ